MRFLQLPPVLMLLGILAALSGCGSHSVNADVQQDAPAAASDKAASATFVKFFEDVGNSASGAKWSISNSSGAKQFALSNTAYSAPKSWIIGGNYWNGENDKLTSVPFTVPAGRTGLKLSFFSRWNIAASDFARIDYSTNNGASWTQVQAFTNGSNAGYPNWTKYTYSLPDTLTPQTWRIRFRFTSNNAGTGWGFGCDSISVYQRQLDAPTGVAAGDNTSGPIDITWDAPADPLNPEWYSVYYSTNPDSGYLFLGNYDPHGSGALYDPADSTVYYFKVSATKEGYPDSPFSHVDSGYEH
jgi:hypothetical protein